MLLAGASSSPGARGERCHRPDLSHRVCWIDATLPGPSGEFPEHLKANDGVVARCRNGTSVGLAVPSAPLELAAMATAGRPPGAVAQREETV
jgi:hypothetical protein